MRGNALFEAIIGFENRKGERRRGREGDGWEGRDRIVVPGVEEFGRVGMDLMG